MKGLLQWGTLQVNRRSFLQRATVGTFGIFTGAAVRAPLAFANHTACIYPCVGPYQAGYCGSAYCDGVGCGSTYCSYVSGFCVGTAACWSYGHDGKVCCDCRCCVGYSCWYCFCGN